MSTATSPDARRGHPDDPEGAPHPDPRPVRGVGAVLLVGGLVGGLTAVVLLLEKLALLADPAYVPSCSIDPVLSCGTIMRTAQATAFGFPNPLIGVATFPVVATVGALVLSGVALPRWTWLSLQFGSMAGLTYSIASVAASRIHSASEDEAANCAKRSSLSLDDASASRLTVTSLADPSHSMIAP